MSAHYANDDDQNSPSSDIHHIENKLGKLVDEYRELRDRLKVRRQTYYEKITRTYFKVATTPHAKPFFSIEGQQYSYNVAVLAIIFLCYIIFCYPQHFHHVYTVIMSILIVARYYFYKQLHWTPFCFDFCYFANYIAMVALYTDSPALLSTAYTVSHGPVLLALIMWKNSLVFHSLDKLTSCAIHFLPGLALHIRLHLVIPAMADATTSIDGSSVLTALPFSFKYNIVYPILYYLMWQIGYNIYFHVLNDDLFREDRKMQSSLRWFVTVDYSTPLVQFALRTARQTGFFKPEDDLCDDEWKTRILFQTFQFLYTLCTMPFSFFSYMSYTFSLIGLLINLAYIINAGATFYLSTAFIKQRMAVVTKKFDAQQRKQQLLQQQTQGNQTEEQLASKVDEKSLKRGQELQNLQLQLDELEKRRSELKKQQQQLHNAPASPNTPRSEQTPKDSTQTPPSPVTPTASSSSEEREQFLQHLLVGNESMESAPEDEPKSPDTVSQSPPVSPADDAQQQHHKAD